MTDFAEFVDSRRVSLWRTAWALTGDAGKAEDLVQTALMKVWPRWTAVTRAGDPEPYVRRTLYTTYVSWWHRRWSAESPTDSLPERASDDEIGRVGLRRDLLTAMSRLPRGQRAVLVCRYFDDLTEAQTAATLGCSVGTVKKQASRALATLRTSLGYLESIHHGGDT